MGPLGTSFLSSSEEELKASVSLEREALVEAVLEGLEFSIYITSYYIISNICCWSNKT